MLHYLIILTLNATHNIIYTRKEGVSMKKYAIILIVAFVITLIVLSLIPNNHDGEKPLVTIVAISRAFRRWNGKTNGR